ncbi:unnamed protein product, partial [Notodromas monacha]
MNETLSQYFFSGPTWKFELGSRIRETNRTGVSANRKAIVVFFRGIQKAAVLLLSLTVAVVSSSDVGVGSTDDSAAASPADDEIACEYAYHRCLNRDGCKTVLGYYLDACDEVQVG